MAEPIDLMATVRDAVKRGASDIVLTVGSPAAIVTSGELSFLETPTLDEEQISLALHVILTEEERQALWTQRALCRTIGIRGVARLRINAFYQRRAAVVTFRLLPVGPPAVEEVGLSADAIDALESLDRGVIVVAGRAGSGRTTIAAAILAALASKTRKHIVTVEQPIEYGFAADKGLVTQIDVGSDVSTLEQGITAARLAHPGIVFLDHMDDDARRRAASSFAHGGTLVLTTMVAANYRRALAALDADVAAFLVYVEPQGRVSRVTRTLSIDDATRDILRTGRIDVLLGEGN